MNAQVRGAVRHRLRTAELLLLLFHVQLVVLPVTCSSLRSAPHAVDEAVRVAVRRLERRREGELRRVALRCVEIVPRQLARSNLVSVLLNLETLR